MQVKIQFTPTGLHVDGRHCFFSPKGVVLFRDDSSSVANYVAGVTRGHPIQGNEKVAFKDGNCSNINPHNLVVFKRNIGEDTKAFNHRIRVELRQRNRKANTIPLRERIPDLETRPTTKGEAWPLRKQIIAMQRIVNKALRRGLPIHEVRNIARTNIRASYQDVLLSDLSFDMPEATTRQQRRSQLCSVFSSERNNPKSNP